MSKDTFVKSAAQGGGSGGGGGPSGNWVLISSGVTNIGGGQTVTLGSIPATPASGTILVAFVGMDSGVGNHLCEGSSAATPNANTIQWNTVINGAGTDLVAKAGANVSACALSWAIYTLVA